MTRPPRSIGPGWPDLGRSWARHRAHGYDARAVARESRPGYDATTVDQVGARLRQTVERLGELADLLPDRPAGESLAAAGHLDADTLERWVRDLRRMEGMLATAKASVIALGDVVKVAQQAGMASTGQWFKQRFNTSSREASRQQQLADTLDRLPRTRDALVAGQLGPEQASLLGHAARRGRLGAADEIEDTLLDTASRTSPEQLRERIRRAEQAKDDDALRRDENRQYALRRASCVKQDDGMWRLDALLPGVEGEMFATALEAFTTPDPADTPPHLRRRADQRLADGLITLSRAVLDNKLAPQAGGLKPHLMVLVPYDGPDPWHPARLDDARQHADERVLAQTAAGTTLSPAATQRLFCDARLSRIVMSPRSEPLDVGRATRTWTVAQHAALAVRDRGCRGPGCDRPAAWCDRHHVDWWSNGGLTDLPNGILLCHQHHRLVHEGGWKLRVDPDTGVATFTDPGGRRYTTHAPDPDLPRAPGRGAGPGDQHHAQRANGLPTPTPEPTDDPDLNPSNREALRLPLANAPPG